MKENKTHIILRISTLLIVMAIIAPTIVKFAHGLENHEHEICYGESTSHLHEIDMDCEFYKFKLNTSYFQISKPIESLDFNTTNEALKSQYHFISDYQQLQTALRGPPVFGLT